MGGLQYKRDVKIWGDGQLQPITSTTDGSKERLDVDAVAEITNPTIEQTTGDDHNTLSIVAGGVDYLNNKVYPVKAMPRFDYIELGYTGTNLTTVVYKTGGSGGTTVATLTLGYTGTNLTSVTRT